jgi:prepilin-type N-terminal cleavage/methylation domain-containing protein
MKKGFTLIELLATIVILGIIATITVPIMIGRINYFKDKAYESLLKSIENAAEEYVNDNLDFLDELKDFGYMNIKIRTLVTEGYLKQDLTNPKTNIPLSLEDIIYVTINYKNRIDIYYDADQKEHPKIVLNGPNIVKVRLNGTYTELNAFATSPTGEDISSQIFIEGIVDTSVEKTYTLKYSVPDSNILERYVIVTSDFPEEDIEKPVLTSNILNNYIETTVGVSITMPIVTATDNVDGVISPISPFSNNLVIGEAGTYHLKYSYTDSSGNRSNILDIKVVVKP